ncbi:MAG: hypothetical protein J0L52_02805 [Caulobacterales bacterium]|nr:hypothetical protein [Caulobacterales bacterium]
MNDAVLELLETAGNVPDPTSGVSITRPSGSDTLTDLAEAFLRGDFSALRVYCGSVNNTNTTGDPPYRPPPARWILTGEVASLSQASMADRTFATLSYDNDRATGSESISADLVVGFGPLEHGGLRWMPYASYDRVTLASSPVNDLTFGVLGFWRSHGHEVRWSADYETDDDFDSSVYRAELAWDAPGLACVDMATYPARATCRYGLRLDYADVADVGSKTSLLGVNEYFRAGGWVNFSYGRPLLDGWLEGTLEYELMEPLDGGLGDAAVGRASLILSPSNASHYRFGIEYENGEDITSLVRSEIIKLTLGVRY